jgi:hypothetical protein
MEEKTNYHITTSMNEGIVEIVFTGKITEYTIKMLHNEVIRTIQDKNAKAVLSDVRALKGHNDAFAAAYFRARNIPEDIQKLPAAVVDLPGNEDFKSFYEITSANAGQRVKWFTDIESARTWLKSLL